VEGTISPADVFEPYMDESGSQGRMSTLKKEVEDLRAAIEKMQRDTSSKKEVLSKEMSEQSAAAVSEAGSGLGAIAAIAEGVSNRSLVTASSSKMVVAQQASIPEDVPVRGHSLESGATTATEDKLWRRQISRVDGEDDVSSVLSQHTNDQDLHRASVVRPMKLKGVSMASLIPRVLFYMCAAALLVLILLVKAYDWGPDGRWQNRGFLPPSLMMTQVSYCIAAAGLVAFTVNLLQQPLILGYLLGGVLVGKECGLGIVDSHADISEFSSLGLVFLLFMIGLELDLSELAKMGKVVILTGLFQFPLCAGIHIGIFTLLSDYVGVSFGDGQYATLYTGMTCGISSTMIVVKVLSELADVDSQPGRLTIGILIFQDIWAIVVLAVQPDLANPQPLKLLKTFGMIALLLVVAMLYAKIVMPAVFLSSSKHVELMLVLSLGWCFFMGCFAILPFIGLSLELASLISGVALATFPYSAEFNGKIKYIRDFFITLFFVGLGMQIPVPTIETLLKALLIAVVVLSVRWIGIFLVVFLLGGGRRLAAVSTINLSQVSEFALVICSLGQDFDHVYADTLTTLIWTFALLAVMSSYTIGYNYAIYGFLGRCMKRLLRMRNEDMQVSSSDDNDAHADRNIIILGFHKVAAMLLAHTEHHTTAILEHMHVICSNEEHMAQIKKKGVTCAYGDISSPDVLEHAFHGEARLVICSITDSLLPSVTKIQALTNLRLLAVCKKVWPNADVIVSADNPKSAQELYAAGADYVLRLSKLSAEKLSELALEHLNHSGHHLTAFHGHRKQDEDEAPRNIISTHSISGRL